MDLTSPTFLWMLAIACLVLWLRMRGKAKPMAHRGRQISIRGNKIVTPISPSTPLACLLEEGHKFGQDYQEKESPELPHGPDCQCEVKMMILGSQDIFTGHAENPIPSPSDLDLSRREPLTAVELRYYKYTLIAHHQDASAKMKKEYLGHADHCQMNEEFQEKVKRHLDIN